MKMIKILCTVALTTLLGCTNTTAQKQPTTMKELTPEQRAVIIDKGTERPFSGELLNNKNSGTYICAQCGAPLYRSQDKFDSGCGWPSFDDQIQGAVRRTTDADGSRTEITCTKCGGHLGHVFTDEGFTAKNTRHCVNSISMEFVPDTATAIFAGGCFWGVEHLMQQQKGVLNVESGYIGGTIANPTYEQVCSKTTGHVEAVRVSYNPSEVSYKTLAQLFFEIHDPTQADGQGPDIGPQYISEIFYLDQQQKSVAQELIALLNTKGYQVKTKLTPATTFYPAEEYHQDYYRRKGSQPYCHSRVKRF